MKKIKTIEKIVSLLKIIFSAFLPKKYFIKSFVRLIQLKLILFFAVFLFIYQGLACAEIPRDSFRILALHEKDILVAAIFNYNSKILELEQDRLTLREDKEWLNLKILHIQDQKRTMPVELERASGVLTYKSQLIDKELLRLLNLNRKHLGELLKLDARVKKKNGDKEPSWWHLEDWVLDLLYPERKDLGKKKKVAFFETGRKNEIFKGRAQLVQEIQVKIKAVKLENWVVLISDKSGLRLEVQLPILFGVGKSSVAKDYKKFLRKFAWLLKPYAVKIEVAGFTDNSPINNKQYSSNLELAADRAVNVVKEFVKIGMNPSLFKIVSRGVNTKKNQDKDKSNAAMKRRVEVNVFFENNEV